MSSICIDQGSTSECSPSEALGSTETVHDSASSIVSNMPIINISGHRSASPAFIDDDESSESSTSSLISLSQLDPIECSLPSSDPSHPIQISTNNQLKRDFVRATTSKQIIEAVSRSPIEIPSSKRQKMVTVSSDNELLPLIEDPATPISPANTDSDNEPLDDPVEVNDDPWSLPSQEMTNWLKIFSNWPDCEKTQALSELVTQFCEMKQLRLLMTIVEPQLQRDFISLLPKELSLYILSFLEPKDLLNASQTCRYWRILCEDNLLWREKCREEHLLDENQTLAHFFKSRLCSSRVPQLTGGTSASDRTASTMYPLATSSTCQFPVPTMSMHSHSGSVFTHSEYKTAFLRQKNIEYNWRFGAISTINENPAAAANSCGLKARRLRPVMQLKGHDDHVITCLQFNPESNIIVSGSDDNTLKVWSSESGSCLRTLTGHTGGVWSSQLSDDNIVISGSTDRTLKVWDALSGQCLHTLHGHTSTVRCMALYGHEVVSGSRDATLRLWDIISGECKYVLVGHMAAVRCVQYNSKVVVSGAYDYLVKVWDPKTETCLHTLEGHTNRVYSLQFDGEHIVSGSLDTSIRVWNASTGVLKSCLIGHQSLTSGMQLRGNMLVSGNADSTVKVWDINAGTCLQTLAGPNKHQSAVTCLQFNNRFVITSSDDGTVKLWDLRTGTFVRNIVTLSSGERGGVVWRIRASNTKLVAAVGSRNGTEETKLLVLDFDVPDEAEHSAVLSTNQENVSQESSSSASHKSITSSTTIPSLPSTSSSSGSSSKK